MSERASGRVGRSAATTTTERWLPMPLWSGRVETENLQTVQMLSSLTSAPIFTTERHERKPSQWMVFQDTWSNIIMVFGHLFAQCRSSRSLLPSVIATDRIIWARFSQAAEPGNDNVFDQV